MFPCAPLEVFSRILGLNRSACRCDGVTGVTGCGVNFSVLSGVPAGRTRPKKGVGLFPTATHVTSRGSLTFCHGFGFCIPVCGGVKGTRAFLSVQGATPGPPPSSLGFFFSSNRFACQRAFENAMLIIGGLTLQSLTFKSGQTLTEIGSGGGI